MLSWVVKSRSPLRRARKSHALRVLHRSARLARPCFTIFHFHFPFSAYPISFPFTFLRTLLRAPKTQLFYFQSLPHSLPKTPGMAEGGALLTSYLSSRFARCLRGNSSSACVSLQYPSPVLLFADHRPLITGPLFSSPLQLALTKNAPATLLESALTKKDGGRG